MYIPSLQMCCAILASDKRFVISMWVVTVFFSTLKYNTAGTRTHSMPFRTENAGGRMLRSHVLPGLFKSRKTAAFIVYLGRT